MENGVLRKEDNLDRFLALPNTSTVVKSLASYRRPP